MPLPRQAVYPGTLDEGYRRELDSLAAGGAVQRLWAKDRSLWPADEEEDSLGKNLAWLDLPDNIGPYMARVADFANSLEAEGFEDAVFVGLGDSALAAETIAQLSLPKRWKRLFVLDSTDPATLRALDKELIFERTIFVFASKSGKHIGSHALLLYFLEQFRLRGISPAGRHFVAVTEEHAYLAHLAKEYHFRGIFYDPPGISGRYSALIHFGLLLTGLCRFTPGDLLIHAASMNQECRRDNGGKSNPALELAAFLGAGAKQGHDRLLLFGTASLFGLTSRVAQLVGVSTSKGGKGLVPIAVELPAAPEAYKKGCLAATFTMLGDEDSAVKKATDLLRHAGVPSISIELSSAEQLGAEVFKWEVATALTCAVLNVNPFVEPELAECTSAAAHILQVLANKGELPSRSVRVREAGIELYAEGPARQEISTLSLSEALRTFFEIKSPQGYVATLAFLDRSPGPLEILRRIVSQLTNRMRVPALLSFGPRYLHELAQVFQGGPSKGLFLMLTGQPAEDVLVPGAAYSFGQLQLALAMGDFEALTRHKRPVLRLHLTEGLEKGLPQLEQVIQQALKNLRKAAR